MPFDDMPAIAQRSATKLVNPTRNDLLILAAEQLERNPDLMYRPLYNVEGTDDGMLRTQITTGTVLEPIVGAILPYREVSNTVGSLMSALDLTKGDVHQVACYCHHAAGGAKAAIVAQRLGAIAAK